MYGEHVFMFPDSNFIVCYSVYGSICRLNEVAALCSSWLVCVWSAELAPQIKAGIVLLGARAKARV